MSTYHDKSVTGGVFQRYNRRNLTPGEHFLIEERSPQGIVVRQPMGADTLITIHAHDEWSDGSSVALSAFNRDEGLLASSRQQAIGGDIGFIFERFAGDRRAIEASISLGLRNRGAGLQEVDLDYTTTVSETRGGRECRRETQMTATQAQHGLMAFALDRDILGSGGEGNMFVDVEWWDGGGLQSAGRDWLGLVFDGAELDDERRVSEPQGGAQAVNDEQWKTTRFRLSRAVFRKRVWDAGIDIAVIVPGGVCIGKVTVTNADELERRSVAYYTIHDPAQGETLTQGLHLRGWTDATQPISDIDLDGLQAIYAWDADAASWLLYSPDVPARFNTIDKLEQGRAYYVRVRNGQTLHWPEAPYGGVGFHLQPGRNLVCWLGTPDKSLTDAIAPLRGMKAAPLTSVTLDGRRYDMEESRAATAPLAYGQALWVEIDAVGPTRWLQF